jgi:hypothetical protein
LSNKNRTVVKDGRIQVKKKRTDRSYLQTEAAPASVDADSSAAPAEPAGAVATEPAPEVTSSLNAGAPASEPEALSAPAVEADPVAAFTAPPPAPVVAAAAAPVVAAPPRGGAARALQQQGVRKRREIDVNELARRDSSYAMHELRRIAILTVLVVVALVVLTLVLR